MRSGSALSLQTNEMNCAPRQLNRNKLRAEWMRINQLLKCDKPRVRTEHDGLTKQPIRKLYVCAPENDVPERRTAHANLAVVVLPLD